jgi:DNA-binding SARP family transcriptional activator
MPARVAGGPSQNLRAGAPTDVDGAGDQRLDRARGAASSLLGMGSSTSSDRAGGTVLIELQLLGGFRVVVDGRAVAEDAWPKRSGADLVKLLALAEGRRMARDAVLEALWPHLDADAAARNLHKAATYARQALGDRRAVVLAEGFVALAPDSRIVSDLERFEAGDEDAYGGELLPEDRYAEWAAPARDRMRERHVELLRSRQRWSELLLEEPGDEEAHRALMRHHGARGDRAAVVRQFRQLSAALAEAGLHPSTETVELHRELARGPAVRAPLAGGAAIVGRDAELARAGELLREARAGNGCALIVLGDTGMGSTRFAEAVAEAAAARGFHTLLGTGGIEEGRTPYQPMRDALEPLVEERPDLLAGLSSGAREAIDRLLGGRETHRRRDPGVDRHRTFSAVGRLLAAAAAERGALVAIDDLHAADDASAALFHYLARGARGQRLVLVATLREGEATGGPAGRVHASLVRQGVARVVRLARLDSASTATLAAQAAGRPLPAETLAAIDRAAGGSPFFIGELAAAVDAAGEITIPATLEQLIEGRLDRLEAVLGDLVPLLAVLQDGFGAEEVAALADIGTGAANAVLEDALEAGLLERFRGGYRLGHAIVRQALCRRLAPARLVDAHAEAARQLSRLGAPPERVAHHLIGAGRGRDAVPLLRDAASWAAEMGAYRDGLDWAAQALDHADDGMRPDLLVLLADLRLGAGDPRAGAAYEAAIAAAPPERIPSLRLRQARARLAAGDVDGATSALAKVEPRGLDEQADLIVWRGILAWHRDDLDEARRAVAEAESLGTEAVRMAELAALLAHTDGRFEQHAQLELSAVWRVPELAGRVFDSYLCVTERVLESGEPYARVAAFAKRLRAEARRAGARRGEAFAATVLGETELLTADLPRARDSLLEAARLAREAGAPGAETLARLRLGEALLHLGDRPAASTQLEEALELAQAPALARHLLFLVYGVLVRLPEDPLEAVRVAERGEQLFDPRWLCPTCPLEYWLASSTVCAQAGELEDAERFAGLVRQASGVLRGGPSRAAVHEADGHVLLARGDRQRARERLGLALEGYAAAGQRLRERRVRETLAGV